VNVVRNIYERSYTDLLHPLDYEQFAPPSFLWALKTMSLVSGFSEYCMRLYPLLCSIAGLWLFWLLLKKMIPQKAAILYPLLLMASGFIFIRYATEVKQYAADVAITLAIVLLAIKTDILQSNGRSFFAKWAISGALAIWFSMPSVFILAGVFAYYSMILIQAKRNEFILLAGMGATWAITFLIYYLLILKPAIQSSYLQDFHKIYFIELLPATINKSVHNFKLFADIIGAWGGGTVLAIVFHLLLIFSGCLFLYRKNKSLLFLFAVPFICLYVAAGLHQFTLLPRVVLFSMPLLLTLAGIGLGLLISIKSAAPKYIIFIAALICLFNVNKFEYIWAPYKNEDFIGGLKIVQQEHISGNHLHINYLMVPVYLYYTTIHPQKDKWKDLLGADTMTWKTNFDSVAKTFQKDAIIYISYDESTLQKEIETDRKYCRSVTKKVFPGGEVVIAQK